MKTVGESGEDELIARLCEGLATSGDLVVGPGDDCAVVGDGEVLTLLKTDAVVEGVHYLPSEDPGRVGWKAVARVLSDFAAMGGEPRELLVTLALPGKTTLEWVEKLYAGMSRCLVRSGGVIAGGETTSLPEGAPIVISVAGRGVVRRERLVTRSGGKVGDKIYVTGRLGGSLAGKHLDFSPRLVEAGWLAGNFLPTAMMDLSDGLAKDLPRLARRSGCGFQIMRDALPLNEGVSIEQALGDGEDYELLFTSGAGAELLEAWAGRFPELELTEVGRLTSEPGEILKGGWEHFRHE
ncbi:MAG: thiamine-phosphate kinase [Akkermansiaceae bacterium]|jgi:thiamine-monophosphate kinase